MPRSRSSWFALGRWDFQTRAGGIEITYANLLTGKLLVCGVARPGTLLPILIEYVYEEGDAGDVVFIDGKLCCYLLPMAS